MITETDFDAKLSSLNRKIIQNKPKLLLAENEMNRLETFDSSCFIDKSNFDEDGTQIVSANKQIFWSSYQY